MASMYAVLPAAPAPGFQARIETEVAGTNAELERLRAKHDLWKVYAPEWELYLSSYEGGPDFVNQKNIFKHQRENPDDYEDRVARAVYWNFPKNLVDFFTDFIYTETIQRDGGANEAWYQDFIKDVNKKGDDINAYMRKVSDDFQIFGMSYTLVDTPKLPDGEGNAITKQQELEMGLRPYWVLIHPEEVTDWTTDDFGKYTYFKRCQPFSEPDGSEIRHYEKYTEWYLDRIVITLVDITQIARPTVLPPKSFDNTLGMIPINVTRFKESKKHSGIGVSFLCDFAYSARRILNLTSLIDEFLYRQCFNMLAKEVDTSIPLRDQEDGVIGSSNVLEYPKGAEKPAYLSPPSDPAKFLQDERAREIGEMFKRASQDTMNELFNGEKSSGFSQAQSFSKTVPTIASRADTLEKAENDLMILTLQLVSKTWDGKIKYKDRYELTNITDALTQLTMLFRDLYLPSETFVKEELKRLVHEMDGKLSPETLAKVTAEIDAMDFNKWQEVQKEALIGQPKSPTDQQKPKSSGTVAESAAESKSPGASSTKKTR